MPSEKIIKHVTIYTDGACVGNPGPGGDGTVLLFGRHRRELSGGYRKTTNNRMELMATIVGLKALKERCSVRLYTDSKYVVDAMTEGWAERWRANGWKRNRKEMALNPDLWEELLELTNYHSVGFTWVRGHSGDAENERCDQLAVEAAHQADLPTDVIYETTETSSTA